MPDSKYPTPKIGKGQILTHLYYETPRGVEWVPVAAYSVESTPHLVVHKFTEPNKDGTGVVTEDGRWVVTHQADGTTVTDIGKGIENGTLKQTKEFADELGKRADWETKESIDSTLPKEAARALKELALRGEYGKRLAEIKATPTYTKEDAGGDADMPAKKPTKSKIPIKLGGIGSKPTNWSFQRPEGFSEARSQEMGLTEHQHPADYRDPYNVSVSKSEHGPKSGKQAYLVLNRYEDDDFLAVYDTAPKFDTYAEATAAARTAIKDNLGDEAKNGPQFNKYGEAAQKYRKGRVESLPGRKHDLEKLAKEFNASPTDANRKKLEKAFTDVFDETESPASAQDNAPKYAADLEGVSADDVAKKAADLKGEQAASATPAVEAEVPYTDDETLLGQADSYLAAVSADPSSKKGISRKFKKHLTDARDALKQGDRNKAADDIQKLVTEIEHDGATPALQVGAMGDKKTLIFKNPVARQNHEIMTYYLESIRTKKGDAPSVDLDGDGKVEPHEVKIVSAKEAVTAASRTRIELDVTPDSRRLRGANGEWLNASESLAVAVAEYRGKEAKSGGCTSTKAGKKAVAEGGTLPKEPKYHKRSGRGKKGMKG